MLGVLITHHSAGGHLTRRPSYAVLVRRPFAGFSPFAALRPSSISWRMASAREATRYQTEIVDRLHERLRHRRDDALRVGLVHAGKVGNAKCMSMYVNGAHCACRACNQAKGARTIGQPSLFRACRPPGDGAKLTTPGAANRTVSGLELLGSLNCTPRRLGAAWQLCANKPISSWPHCARQHKLCAAASREVLRVAALQGHFCSTWAILRGGLFLGVRRVYSRAAR